MKSVKTAALCTNANGVPEFYYKEILVTEEGYKEGDHYNLLVSLAELDGLDASLLTVFDEFDVAGKQLQAMSDFFKK